MREVGSCPCLWLVNDHKYSPLIGWGGLSLGGMLQGQCTDTSQGKCVPIGSVWYLINISYLYLSSCTISIVKALKEKFVIKNGMSSFFFVWIIWIILFPVWDVRYEPHEESNIPLALLGQGLTNRQGGRPDSQECAHVSKMVKFTEQSAIKNTVSFAALSMKYGLLL